MNHSETKHTENQFDKFAFGISDLICKQQRVKHFERDIPKLYKRYKLSFKKYQIYGRDSLEVIL